MAKHITVGIDIGSATIQSVIGTWDVNKETLQILGLGSAVSTGVRRGRIVEIEAASKSLETSLRVAQRQAGVRVKSAFLGMGGAGLEAFRSKGSVAVSRASSEISEFDVERALEAAQANLHPLINHEILHSLPLGFTIDAHLKTTSPVGMSGTKLECQAIFITVLQKDIRNLVKCAELAGIGVEDVIAAPLASSRAILSDRNKDVGTILMDIGAATVSLMAYEEGMPISLEVLPIGSANITHDVAIGFKTTLDEAEELKRSFGSQGMSLKKQLAEIVSARLSDIFDLTNKHLKKIERERLLPAGVILTGGGTRLAELVDFAKDCLELPVQIGSLQRVNLPSAIDSRLWAVAVGLCLLANDSPKQGSEFGLEIGHKAKNIVVRWIKSLLP